MTYKETSINIKKESHREILIYFTIIKEELPIAQKHFHISNMSLMSCKYKHFEY